MLNTRNIPIPIRRVLWNMVLTWFLHAPCITLNILSECAHLGIRECHWFRMTASISHGRCSTPAEKKTITAEIVISPNAGVEDPIQTIDSRKKIFRLQVFDSTGRRFRRKLMLILFWECYGLLLIHLSSLSVNDLQSRNSTMYIPAAQSHGHPCWTRYSFPFSNHAMPASACTTAG